MESFRLLAFLTEALKLWGFTINTRLGADRVEHGIQ